MLVEVVAGLVIAAVLAVTAWYVAGGRRLRAEPRLEPRPGLPDDRAVVGDDVDAVRLPVVVRGYRMDVVDEVLDRLADELRVRDEQIARLSGDDAAGAPDVAESDVDRRADVDGPAGVDGHVPAHGSSDDAAGSILARYGGGYRHEQASRGDDG